jgi:hypothetical protein
MDVAVDVLFLLDIAIQFRWPFVSVSTASSLPL